MSTICSRAFSSFHSNLSLGIEESRGKSQTPKDVQTSGSSDSGDIQFSQGMRRFNDTCKSFKEKYLSLVTRNFNPLMIFCDIADGVICLTQGTSKKLIVLKRPTINEKHRILKKCLQRELFGKICADVTGFVVGSTSIVTAFLAVAKGITLIKAFGLIVATLGLSNPIGLAIFGGILALGLVISLIVLACNASQLQQLALLKPKSAKI